MIMFRNFRRVPSMFWKHVVPGHCEQWSITQILTKLPSTCVTTCISSVRLCDLILPYKPQHMMKNAAQVLSSVVAVHVHRASVPLASCRRTLLGPLSAFPPFYVAVLGTSLTSQVAAGDQDALLQSGVVVLTEKGCLGMLTTMARRSSVGRVRPRAILPCRFERT